MFRGTPVGAWSALALAAVTGGCESYSPAPLDLTAHRVAFEGRLDDVEPISAFAARLRSAGADVPDHFDPTDGLTRAEGEVAALFWNADLRLARLRAGIAAATAEHAGLWEDPVFGFDGAEIVSPSGPFEYGLTLGFTIPLSGRLEIEKDRAAAAHSVELRRVVDLEWRTRADVRVAWARWSAETERERLVLDLLGQVERIRAITDQLEEFGELSRVEARLFVVETLSLREHLAAANVAARRERRALLALLGLPATTDVELIPALAPPYTPSPGPGDDLIRELIDRNTTLAVRRAAYRVAEDTLRLEIRKQWPDLTIGGGYGNEDDDRLLLGVSVPIPILNGNRAAIAEAGAARDLARADAETTFERLSGDLTGAIDDRYAARTRLAILESEVLPLLEAQASEIEEIVALGEVDTLLLLESVKRQFDVRTSLLDRRVDEAVAGARVAALLGLPATGDPDPHHHHEIESEAPSAAGVQP